ncbi:hypothetical protein BP5796_12941 [Coleophoma crateriformis]|uniref:CBM-cenC domain-containing protein n=1 Tax=Coleophoma crateriformis TaxID=565419 RepID=A0A3D8Q636_9HELO|nr:hypothetical protein BP5796_12941 [Coleophoma crateriformis]
MSSTPSSTADSSTSPNITSTASQDISSTSSSAGSPTSSPDISSSSNSVASPTLSPDISSSSSSVASPTSSPNINSSTSSSTNPNTNPTTSSSSKPNTSPTSSPSANSVISSTTDPTTSPAISSIKNSTTTAAASMSISSSKTSPWGFAGPVSKAAVQSQTFVHQGMYSLEIGGGDFGLLQSVPVAANQPYLLTMYGLVDITGACGLYIMFDGAIASATPFTLVQGIYTQYTIVIGPFAAATTAFQISSGTGCTGNVFLDDISLQPFGIVNDGFETGFLGAMHGKWSSFVNFASQDNPSDRSSSQLYLTTVSQGVILAQTVNVVPTVDYTISFKASTVAGPTCTLYVGFDGFFVGFVTLGDTFQAYAPPFAGTAAGVTTVTVEFATIDCQIAYIDTVILG